jgi:hypothetical protein
MAKTLWPMGTIVCFDGFEEMPYRLLDRVTEGHTKYIPVLDIESMEIEWTKLDELKYLDKPETYKEYYYAVRRKNSKTIRRTRRGTKQQGREPARHFVKLKKKQPLLLKQ